MAIPLSYNLRNLMERKTTTIMTALGIGLTVAVMLGILGLLAGLEGSFQATGDPLHVMVLRKGATAELTSLVNKQDIQLLRAKRGMAMYGGEPMAALELLTVISLENAALIIEHEREMAVGGTLVHQREGLAAAGDAAVDLGVGLWKRASRQVRAREIKMSEPRIQHAVRVGQSLDRLPGVSAL